MPKRKAISKRLRRLIEERDGHRCSYCRCPEWFGIPMAIDHIIPLGLGGETVLENLALCCYRCNEFKGDRVQAVDSESASSVTLFNPSRAKWRAHFGWSEDGLRILGKTASGRATIDALRLNSNWIITARRFWIVAGVHPPLE